MHSCRRHTRCETDRDDCRQRIFEVHQQDVKEPCQIPSLLSLNYFLCSAGSNIPNKINLFSGAPSCSGATFAQVEIFPF